MQFFWPNWNTACAIEERKTHIELNWHSLTIDTTIYRPDHRNLGTWTIIIDIDRANEPLSLSFQGSYHDLRGSLPSCAEFFYVTQGQVGIRDLLLLIYWIGRLLDPKAIT